MKNNKKLLSKFLTIILSTMMIFSSTLLATKDVDASLLDLFKSKITVTFMKQNDNGSYSTFKTYKIAKGTSLAENNITATEVGYPTSPKNVGQSETYWYDKDYVLIFKVSESRFDFNSILNSSITLYPKYISEDQYDKYFDFRVKGTNGTFVKDGYSYYRYYDDSTGLANIVDNFLSISDFTKYQVIDNYDFVMRNDQVVYEQLEDEVYNAIVVDNKVSGTIDSTNNEILEDEDLKVFVKTHANKNIVKVSEENNVKTYKIGDYYQGTAFDIAIQEAPEGSEIELLRDLYITKPIEIWGDIDFNLNGHKIYFNENSARLNKLHYFDKIRKSDLIISKHLYAAIVVANANSKIHDGTIINIHQSGRGVVDFSFDKGYKATLENLTINCETRANEVGVAVEAGYNFLTTGGFTTEEKAGYIDVVSGKYKGSFMNTNNGDLVIYHGVESTQNPLFYDAGAVNTNVTIEEGYQVWGDNNDNTYKYVVDTEAEVEIGDTSPKQYRTLDAAIKDLANYSSKTTIKLLKNIDLNKSSYATNGVYDLSSSFTYTIDNNKKTIFGNEINVTNGSVTFTGFGYYKTAINVKDSGNVIILDGHYNQIYNDRTGTGAKNALTVKGGNFFNNLLNTNEIEYFDANKYMCNYREVYDYPYSVINIEDGPALSLIIDNVEQATKYNSFVKLMSDINELPENSSIIIKLNNTFTTNDSIRITRPLVLDLNGKELVSTVDFNVNKSVGYASIYVDIDSKYSSGDFNIVSGYFYNKSLANDTNTVYGIYINKGNVNIDNVIMRIEPDVCDKVYGIYNNSANSRVTLTSLTSASMKTNENVTNSDITFIYNKGDMKIGFVSTVSVDIDDEKESVTAIRNLGNLEVCEGATIVANGSLSETAEVQAINSTGNVNIHGSVSDGTVIYETTVNAKGNRGVCYSIYQAPSAGNSNKSIVVDDGAIIGTSKKKDGSNAYGIYVGKLDDDSVLTNVYLGKCRIEVDAYNKSAFGVQTYGGYVYAGTVNGSAITSGMFDRNSTQTHDDIRVDGYDKFAKINVIGGNKTVGIDCNYGPYDKNKSSQVISQLVNASIVVNASGTSSYCAKASDEVVGIEIIDGYYYSNVNNRLVTNDRVFCRNGFYNRDVSLNALTNNLCVKLNPAVSFENRTYEYTIDGSGCRLFVSIKPEEILKVKFSIEYDARMELEPDRYGVQFTYNPKASGNMSPVVKSYRISDSEGIKVNGRYVYTFNIPFVLIGDDIKVSIVKYTDEANVYNVEKVVHEVLDYSPEDYYYDILKNDNNKYTPAVRDLAAASLRLGASAQKAFDHNENALVDARLSTNNYLDGNNSRYTSTVVHSKDLDTELKQNNNAYNVNHSLILGSNTTLRTYFSVDEGTDISKYTVYCEGYAEPLDINKHSTEESKDIYYVDISGINILNIGIQPKIKIVDPSGSTCTIEFSPLDFVIYATSKVMNTNVSEETKVLMDAYYQFYLAANKFLY